jgi:hypothetical protein
MTLEQYAYLAEIVGVMFLIASLVYVGRQLQQNTEMMRAESRNSIQHNHQQEILTPVQYPEIWRGFTGEELSDEMIRVNGFLISSLRSREHEWIQYRNGALDKTSWTAFSKAIPLVLSSKHARSWWAATKTIYDTQFANMVDGMLEKENLQSVHVGQAGVMNEFFHNSKSTSKL